MIVLDGEKLRAFWDELARGFQRDPLEITLWIILVLSIIIIPAVFYLIKRKITQRRVIKSENRRFEEIINRKNLAPLETDMVHQLKTYFKRVKVTDILTSPPAFNACAKQFLSINGANGAGLAKLRLKLGLSGSSVKSSLHSSAELFPNLKVKVHAGGVKSFRTIINSINEDSIEIKTNSIINTNRRVILEVERDTGCYLIHTTVSGIENGIIKLNHSEKIEHIQNRNYFRRRLRLPVIIKTGNKEYTSYLIDLGGGGARVKNPGFSVNKGENLLLSLNFNKKDKLILNSRIERVSKDQSSLSVHFNNIKEAQRDRIIKFILK
jgi:hypothetical protein